MYGRFARLVKDQVGVAALDKVGKVRLEQRHVLVVAAAKEIHMASCGRARGNSEKRGAGGVAL